VTTPPLNPVLCELLLFAVKSISYGKTVGVVTSEAPDVANDKALSKGHFRFKRTGDNSQAPEFAFSLPSGSLTYTNAATPANTNNAPNTDYTLWFTNVKGVTIVWAVFDEMDGTT